MGTTKTYRDSHTCTPSFQLSGILLLQLSSPPSTIWTLADCHFVNVMQGVLSLDTEDVYDQLIKITLKLQFVQKYYVVIHK